ncbi:MAG: DUF4124 domain-containing protein [Pseudomonadota bacterium]
MDKITKQLALALLFGVLAPSAAQAQSVFLCTSASGGKELTDTHRPGCKTLDVRSSTQIPAPRAKAGAGGGARTVAAPASTPADFPKVDSGIQKMRDNDRRDILNQEMRTEAAKLAQLQAEFKNGEPDRQGGERNYAKYQERVILMRENINRAEKNIEALQREIDNIR